MSEATTRPERGDSSGGAETAATARAHYALTKTRFSEGVWEGLVATEEPEAPQPEIAVTHLGTPLTGISLAATDEAGRWRLSVPVPSRTLGDGVQTFVVSEARSGATLCAFTLVAGTPLEADLRAEIDLLRAELDLLKRAFRRHCREGG